ncbi:MAG: SDR family oxidoreductase [Caenibius sp.]
MSGSTPLAGKRVVITGGSKGLGRALTEALTGLGAKVCALARPSSELDEVSAIDGGWGIPCDLRNSAAIRDAIAKAAEAMGGIDILVNNAGVAAPVPFASVTDEMIDDQIAINFAAAIHTSRAALPWLLKAQGHVLNVSSETVHRTSPFLGVYAGTKAALERFSLELRDEFRSKKLRVTILRSGTIATDISGKWPKEFMDEFLGLMTRSGYREWSGESVPPESMAKGIIGVLSMPSDLNLDVVEMRSALPWFPGE